MARLEAIATVRGRALERGAHMEVSSRTTTVGEHLNQSNICLAGTFALHELFLLIVIVVLCLLLPSRVLLVFCPLGYCL